MKKEQKKEEWVSTKHYEDLDQNQNTLLCGLHLLQEQTKLRK